jgi:hypothetical protein
LERSRRRTEGAGSKPRDERTKNTSKDETTKEYVEQAVRGQDAKKKKKRSRK